MQVWSNFLQPKDLNVDLGNDDIAPAAVTATRFGTQSKPESAAATQQGRLQTQSQQSGAKASTPSSQVAASNQHSLYAPPDLVLQDGRTYPEVRTSTILLNGEPQFNGKKISELEIDADLAEHLKPWRAPGADQSDYFNYGFDEFTWAQYVMRHSDMDTVIAGIRDNQQGFEAMFGGMPSMPGMPGIPGGGSAGANAGGGAGGGSAGNNAAPAGPGQGPANSNANGGMGMGMPNENDMMAAMQQMMSQQGINDPTQIDFGTFMQQMGGFPGGGVPQGPSGSVPGGPSGWQSGGGGGQSGGGGRSGRGNRRW